MDSHNKVMLGIVLVVAISCLLLWAHMLAIEKLELKNTELKEAICDLYDASVLVRVNLRELSDSTAYDLWMKSYQPELEKILEVCVEYAGEE